ncbi:MAG: hypothetical protein P1U74_04900 [Legionellaceae bacterium]|nr:hypothetical protein [Legionellaceae bacterium]
MRNKYFEKFFLLTEQNIATSEHAVVLPPSRSDKSQFSNYGISILLLIFLLISLVLFNIKYYATDKIALNVNSLRDLSTKKIVASETIKTNSVIPSLHTFQDAVSLVPKKINSFILGFHSFKKVSSLPPEKINSFIPGFRYLATRQTLHYVPLKKMELALLSGNDYDNSPESRMLLMDKVLVVPKFFG